MIWNSVSYHKEVVVGVTSNISTPCLSLTVIVRNPRYHPLSKQWGQLGLAGVERAKDS